MKALIRDNVAVNVVTDEALATSFHPDTAAQFVTVPDNVQVGWRKVGSAWRAPDPVAPVAPTYPPEAYVVGITAFKMRFTPTKLLNIRASDNPLVKTFLAELVDDQRTTDVNLADPFVTSAVELLASLGLIAEADVATILAPN